MTDRSPGALAVGPSSKRGSIDVMGQRRNGHLRPRNSPASGGVSDVHTTPSCLRLCQRSCPRCGKRGSGSIGNPPAERARRMGCLIMGYLASERDSPPSPPSFTRNLTAGSGGGLSKARYMERRNGEGSTNCGQRSGSGGPYARSTNCQRLSAKRRLRRRISQTGRIRRGRVTGVNPPSSSTGATRGCTRINLPAGPVSGLSR